MRSSRIVAIFLVLLAVNAEDDTTGAVIKLKNNGDDYDVNAEILYKYISEKHYRHSFSLRKGVMGTVQIERGRSQIELKIWVSHPNVTAWFRVIEDFYPIPTNRCVIFEGCFKYPTWTTTECDGMGRNDKKNC